jgi:hypothetical protein
MKVILYNSETLSQRSKADEEEMIEKVGNKVFNKMQKNIFKIDLKNEKMKSANENLPNILSLQNNNKNLDFNKVNLI